VAVLRSDANEILRNDSFAEQLIEGCLKIGLLAKRKYLVDGATRLLIAKTEQERGAGRERLFRPFLPSCVRESLLNHTIDELPMQRTHLSHRISTCLPKVNSSR